MAAHGEAEWPQIVDAVGVVGMGMAHEDAIKTLHASVDQLLAQIGRGVHEDRGRATGSVAFEQHRAAAATVLRVRRIARAPSFRNPRHAAGRATAQDRQSQRQCDDPVGGGSLEKKLKVLARVAAASDSSFIPRA